MLLRLAVAVSVSVALLPFVAVRADDLPKLAIYDFAVQGDATGTAGRDFADAIASDVRSAGGVDVVRGATGIATSGARADARAHGADYFVIGVIQPFGGGTYNVLTQMVRTRTGLLMWSTSAQAKTAADLNGQGTAIHDVMLADVRANSFPTISSAFAGAPPATPAPTPAPTPTSAADVLNVPLSKPTIAPPSAFAVLMLGGTAEAGDRAFATRIAADNIRRRGSSAAAATAPAQTPGPDACAATGAADVVGGSLDLTRVETLTALPSTTAAVTLTVYDCRTHVFSKPLTATTAAPIGTDAIHGAIDGALASYFGSAPPPPHV